MADLENLDTYEQIGEEIGNDDDPEPSEYANCSWLCCAIVGCLLLEILVILVLNIQFSVIKEPWIIFGICLALLFSVPCGCAFCCEKEKGALFAWLFFAIVPFAVYMGLSMNAYVEKCEYAQKNMTIGQSKLGWYNTNATVFVYYEVDCDSIFPANFAEMHPVVADAGNMLLAMTTEIFFPLFYVFVFVKCIPGFLDVPLSKNWTSIRLFVLNMFDVSNFITLPMTAEVFVFVKDHARPFLYIILTAYGLAFLVTMLTTIGFFTKASKSWRQVYAGELHGTNCCTAVLSLVLIDVPFLVIRLFCTFYLSALPSIFLAKNLIFGISDIATVCVCGDRERLSCIDWLIDFVDTGEAAGEVDQIELRKQKSRLDKEQNLRKKVIASARKTVDQQKADLEKERKRLDEQANQLALMEDELKVKEDQRQNLESKLTRERFENMSDEDKEDARHDFEELGKVLGTDDDGNIPLERLKQFFEDTEDADLFDYDKDKDGVMSFDEFVHACLKDD